MGKHITLEDMKRYQKRKEEEVTTIGEYKALGRELRDEFDLETPEALAILRDDTDKMIKILDKSAFRMSCDE